MLRAAHLAGGASTDTTATTTASTSSVSRKVLLVVPWVEPEQQALIYPHGLTFETRQQQAEYILKGK